MITVVLVCWKRFQHFEDTVKFWLKQPKVSQVIVMDNSGTFKTNLPILLLNINRNLGPIVRYPAAQLAENDIIIFCDDDANHRSGLVEDFLKHFKEDRILGVMGVHWKGDTFIECRPPVLGKQITAPVKVDYVPCNTCMTHRKHCLVDIRTYPWGSSETVWGGEKNYNKVPPVWIDDYWWRLAVNKKFPNVERWVIPTKRASFHSEGGDKNAIHKNPKVFVLLEEIYQKERRGEKIL